MLIMIIMTMYFIMCFVSYGVILYREQYRIEYYLNSYHYITFSEKTIKHHMDLMYPMNKTLSILCCFFWPMILTIIYTENRDIKKGIMFNKNNIYH